jgi:hypothetical protein
MNCQNIPVIAELFPSSREHRGIHAAHNSPDKKGDGQSDSDKPDHNH